MKTKEELLILEAFKNTSDAYFHIHIDELDLSCGRPDEFYKKSIYLYDRTLRIREMHNFKKFCVLCLPLVSEVKKRGINFSSISELENEFTLEPPSIYFAQTIDVFKNTPMEQIDNSDCSFMSDIKYYYFYSEYMDLDDDEYRRSIWISDEFLLGLKI